MFYSETLLSKTGPLARVWLSANLERKLNKTHILQSNIENSVNAIIDQGQAPMALRLSGQLLLGVARIYSRKARYLMDDCNDALLRIKIAFRPGNAEIDLLGPAVSTVPNPGLTVTDEIAGEIQFPQLDESLFNADPMDLDLGGRSDDPLNWTSQLPSDPLAIEVGRKAPVEEPTVYDDDLGLELDIGIGAPPKSAAALPAEEVYEDDLGLNFGGDDDGFQLGNDTELPVDDDRMAIDEEPAAPADVSEFQPRNSESPLSSARASEARDIDQTELSEVGQITARQPAAKKRKVLPTDRETMLSNAVIKAQQSDRSAILKPLSALPKDPILLALMQTMQSSGFVSSLMNGDRGMAPQLRGLLSIEAVRKSSTLKRKRDSGVADLETEAEQDMPQIEIPEDETVLHHDEGVADLSRDEPSAAIEQAFEDDAGFVPIEDEEIATPAGDNFDETTAPLLYPEEQGVISVGTQHAVHILRDHFGGSAEAASSRKGALFQDLYPEARTTKAEATKMFFETLVLATKDAIKVEQSSNQLGMPIRIRPKRNLWGEWAEREAGGEIAQQATQVAVSA